MNRLKLAKKLGKRDCEKGLSPKLKNPAYLAAYGRQYAKEQITTSFLV